MSAALFMVDVAFITGRAADEENRANIVLDADDYHPGLRLRNTGFVVSSASPSCFTQLNICCRLRVELPVQRAADRMPTTRKQSLRSAGIRPSFAGLANTVSQGSRSFICLRARWQTGG